MATITQTSTSGSFVNEPLANYRNEENARGMREAIAKVRKELGREYDLVIGGKRVKTTGILFRTAEILRKRKYEFNAWLVLEVGKNFDEADADTCEAIDFLELYARQALVLDKSEPVVQLP